MMKASMTLFPTPAQRPSPGRIQGTFIGIAR
jgi:hypothetical protein